MATHEIPKADWETYLTAFTGRHQGALVTIEDVDPASTPKTKGGDLPFVSIGYKAHEGDSDAIELVTSKGTHRIASPKAVFHKPGAGVLSSEVNPDEVLEVTSESKPPIHLLTFRHA